MKCTYLGCGSEGAVDCYYDNGEWSIPIKACFSCRVRLRDAGQLTVNRAEDLPNKHAE